jgi:hypothetical protein
MSQSPAGLADGSRISVAPAPQLRRAAWFIVGASLGLIGLTTLIPAPRELAAASPLCLVCGSYGGVDAFLNVLLFVPLGVGLARAEIPRNRALVLMCGISLLIETVQFLGLPGRDGTVGDLLTNSIGGGLGFFVAQHAREWVHPPRRLAMVLVVGWVLLWLTLQAISSFAFAASFPPTLYYGQIARPLRGFAVFHGRVRGATIGSTPVNDSLFSNSEKSQEELRNGTAVSAVIVASRATIGVAPILRVADSEQRQIILLAQKGTDMVFGARSGAARLRLRSVLFSLPDAFPDGAHHLSEADSDWRLSSSYGKKVVALRVEGRGGVNDRSISLHPSQSWMLLVPFQWYANGGFGERLLTWIWIVLWILPIGYWARHSSRELNRRRRWTIAAISGFTLVLAGFAIIPSAFGLGPESPGDVLAAFAGLAAGGALVSGGRVMGAQSRRRVGSIRRWSRQSGRNQ